MSNSTSAIQVVLPDGTKRDLAGPRLVDSLLDTLGYAGPQSPVSARGPGGRKLSPEDWMVDGDRIVLEYRVRGG